MPLSTRGVCRLHQSPEGRCASLRDAPSAHPYPDQCSQTEAACGSGQECGRALRHHVADHDGDSAASADEPPPGQPDCGDLGAVREAELHGAAAALGVARVELLGFRDSGFAGDPPPRSLCAADPAEVAVVLTRLAVELRPVVVMVLDGSDGHRDHLAVRTAMRAAPQIGAPAPRHWRACQRAPSSATDPAGTFRDSPVTRRSATAAAPDRLLDTLRPCPAPHEQALPLTRHEVASGHVEAPTTGHGSLLLVDDCLKGLQTAVEAGDPHLPRPGRCWGRPLKGVGAAGVVERLDPLRLPLVRQSMTAGHLCNCPPRSRNRQQVGQRPLRSIDGTNRVRLDLPRGVHAGGPAELVRTLEGHNGLCYATIKILTVNESRGIEIPAGSRGPDGRPLGPHVFTVDNCPAGGVLLLTDEEED